MYSFEPTEEQKMVIDAARRLAAREFRPRMRDSDEKGEPDPAWMDEGWALSLLPASIPEEFGGFGANSALTWALAAEELA
jgi:alkylation response protein AidB-like acyl-CoA dehydrogenase